MVCVCRAARARARARIMQFEENKANEQERMVCFCTNVAETSLTVPGVKLVIDSGLAKEARFDPVRRLTVVEEKVSVSQHVHLITRVYAL